MKSHDVKIWTIKVNTYAKSKRKSYTVRWKVRGQEFSKTFGTRSLADNFRSDLKQAANKGEAFDTEAGLPESMQPVKVGLTWLELCEMYVAMKWTDAAANSRKSMLEAIVTITPVLTAKTSEVPSDDVLRKAIQLHLIPGKAETLDQPHADAIAWLRGVSVPVKALHDAETLGAGLDALGKKLDGKASAATVRRRKRAVIYNILQYGVELKELDHNPIERLRVRSKRVKISQTVDRRVVANPKQARELLTCLTYVGDRDAFRGWRLRAFFGAMYFTGLRPGEAMGLRDHDCHLPAACQDCGKDLTNDFAQEPSDGCAHENVVCGWGLYTLEKTRPQSGKLWTDSGEVHDDRGLKHRPESETRPVPVPPEQVVLTRQHIRLFGVAPSGQLFRSPKGNPVTSTTYSRVLGKARELALTPVQVRSPLAGTPYDLRHACLSLQLNAGVPATKVAENAGNSVEVLLAIYAKCIDGDDEVCKRRIEAALTWNE